MPVYPYPIKEYPELDYKLGIKSSLNKISSVLALTYILYVVNERKPHLVYSEEYNDNNQIKIRLLPELLSKIKDFFPNINECIIDSNPLFTAQMEALQVGLQLIYSLTRVSFVDGSASTKERSGGNRYAKQFDFGTNIKLLDLFLCSFSRDQVFRVLESWLNNETYLDDNVINQGLKMYFTIFSENVPAKIRNEKEEEIIFKQIGIYDHLTRGENVVDTDAKENVGPFRVFKNIYKEGVHPFINVNNGFSVKAEDLESLIDYSQLVNNSLTMLPKREIITTELENELTKEYEFNSNSISRQIIYYGAPGTGKSYRIKGLVRDGNHVRTTFHPDSDYASFVGAYKPTMIEISSRDMAGHVILDKGNEVKEKKIVYEFVAQAFLQAYTEAWKRSVGQMTDKEGKNVEMPEGMDDKYYLVIEEINRGNCAQIFGDLFQLLDRDDNGESSYAIRPDQDMKRYLAEQFKDIEALPETIRRGEEMKLPSNLYIFATMNTSDQSLFPIDSAFKRRWDWEYVPIKDEKKGYFIKVGDSAYLWSDFLEKINETILRVTQSDDKQMGYWFVHLPEGQKEISTDKFVGKVLFYLWNDVFKDFGDGEDTIFIGEKEDSTKYELRFKDFFGDDRNERIVDLMRYNKVEPTVIEDETEEETLSGEVAPANGGESEWQAQFDNYWKGFQDIWAKAPNIKNRFNRFHANAMLLNVDGSENVRMRFSLHPTNWHKVSINLRVADGSPEAEMLKTNLDKIRELTGEQGYQYVVDRKYGLVQLRSNELDFKNQEEVAASYDWLINQGEKLLSAFNSIRKEV